MGEQAEVHALEDVLDEQNVVRPVGSAESLLIYDIEILKAIPDAEKDILPNIEYCQGWEDKANMGVSVICAYDDLQKRYRVFTKEKFGEFQALASDRIVCGFNSIAFDDVVLAHNGITVGTSYDLLQELWVAAGLGREFRPETHATFGLNAVSKANGFGMKTGYGGFAPVEWQRGEYGSVIDYCLQDVRLTWLLVEKAIRYGSLRDPRDWQKWLRMAHIL